MQNLDSLFHTALTKIKSLSVTLVESESGWNKIKHLQTRKMLDPRYLSKGRETSSDIIVTIFFLWTPHKALQSLDLSETKIGTQPDIKTRFNINDGSIIIYYLPIMNLYGCCSNNCFE